MDNKDQIFNQTMSLYECSIAKAFLFFGSTIGKGLYHDLIVTAFSVNFYSFSHSYSLFEDKKKLRKD